jgi:hypothetical protein
MCGIVWSLSSERDALVGAKEPEEHIMEEGNKKYMTHTKKYCHFHS